LYPLILPYLKYFIKERSNIAGRYREEKSTVNGGEGGKAPFYPTIKAFSGMKNNGTPRRASSSKKTRAARSFTLFPERAQTALSNYQRFNYGESNVD
jgi:hypothetical protein